MAQHALVTGLNISGRIPVDHEAFPAGHVDVTPDVLYFDEQEHALAVAEAIEDEHFVRRTHPAQLGLKALDDPEQYPDGVTDEHRKLAHSIHREVTARVNARNGGK